MRIFAMGAAAAAAVAVAHAARAEYTLIDGNGFGLRAGVNAAAAYLNEPNTCYGESSEASFCDYRFDSPQERDIQWVDGFVQARLAGDYDVGAAGRLFGEASVVASATRGAGDTFRITANGEELFPELYYAGWASGDVFPGLGTDALKVSYGNQRFTIGDGFVVYDGVGDWLRKSAFYTAPRRAFRKAGVVHLDTGPVRAAAFMLGGSADRNGIRLAGVDLEYVDEARGTLGLSYIRVRDDSDNSSKRFHGMITVSLRAQGRPLSAPGWSSLFLSGEYVDQSGAADIGENAWYVEAGYGFDDAPWKPYVGYRFNRFSEGYNKLYPGFSRGWGTWFYGEVLTNYFWHANLQIHMLQARAAPADNLAITANLYDIDFVDVEPDIGDRNATQEFNLIADWTITPNMGLSPIFGVSFPGEGITRRSDFGDETAYLFGLYAWASF